MIDKMDEELQKKIISKTENWENEDVSPSVSTIFQQLLQGEFESQVICKNCENISIRTEKFYGKKNKNNKNNKNKKLKKIKKNKRSFYSNPQNFCCQKENKKCETNILHIQRMSRVISSRRRLM